MSNIRNLKLEVVLAAIDKATKPIKAVMGSSSGLSKQLNATKDKLKELNQAQGSITAFRALTKDAKETGDKLAAARQKLKEMGAQMAAAGPPTEAMTRKLKSAEIAVEKLTLANRKKIDAARAAKLAVDANGISAAKLGTHERELAAKIDVATAAMQRQQDKLAKLSALQNRQRGARSRYEQSLEGRDRLAGAGATTMAAGTAAGLPIVKMIRDYSSYEDAMLGVARQVEGARDANGKLKAYWHNLDAAEKGEVIVDANTKFERRKTVTKRGRLSKRSRLTATQQKATEPSAANFKVLRHIYATEATALQAAKAAWEKIQRGVAEFSITLDHGRPEIFPELPAKVSGFKPAIDGCAWLISKATHIITDGGFTTAIELEMRLEDLQA
ncbi:hypothetical protein [Vogesella indigofera]|uniref:hypothetical protein n=1 Tax=Vogesella indigofera TaxID=45465 RepID=UPI00234EACF0|nr:hypothetical protein [Vogesella indigofera]MDC7707728.1 hypothetical protein [Vogesella indigofera]